MRTFILLLGLALLPACASSGNPPPGLPAETKLPSGIYLRATSVEQAGPQIRVHARVHRRAGLAYSRSIRFQIEGLDSDGATVTATNRLVQLNQVSHAQPRRKAGWLNANLDVPDTRKIGSIRITIPSQD